jgi:hypothetical protein
VLLIVAPERARREQPTRRGPDGQITLPPLPPLKAPGPSGYRLTAIDTEFGRRLTQAGGLWSLVPTTMAVLRYKDLPEPDPYESLTPDEKERLLYSLLTPAQWRKLGSPDGVGSGDLDRTQRALFLAMLPQPFRVQVTAPGEPPRLVELTPEQAAGTRLTLRRTLDWSFTQEGRPNGTVSIGIGGAQRTDGRPTLRIIREEPHRFRSSPFGEDDQAAEPVPVFGVPIREAVPNRPKPGDLNFEATVLARAVTLAGVGTVGDLVKRVAEASGLELYADPRFAGLAVHVRGDSARAADILQALCLSVTGTFRKVEDEAGEKAWVLTDDLQGLAVRHGAIRRWARTAVARNNALLAQVADRLRAAQPEQYVGWAEDDPSGVTPDGALRQKIDTYLQQLRTPTAPATAAPSDVQAVVRREEERHLLVPVQELPAAAREIVTKQIESWGRIAPAGAGQARPRLREDAVRIDVQMTPAWIVPGVGIADAGRSMSGTGAWTSMVGAAQADARLLRSEATRPRTAADASLAATALPAALPASGDRGLMVSPESPEEAASAAAAAVRLGMTHLWLSVTPGRSAGTVAGWAKAARAAAPRLGLIAEVRALRLPREEMVARREPRQSPTGISLARR